MSNAQVSSASTDELSVVLGDAFKDAKEKDFHEVSDHNSLIDAYKQFTSKAEAYCAKQRSGKTVSSHEDISSSVLTIKLAVWGQLEKKRLPRFDLVKTALEGKFGESSIAADAIRALLIDMRADGARLKHLGGRSGDAPPSDQFDSDLARFIDRMKARRDDRPEPLVDKAERVLSESTGSKVTVGIDASLAARIEPELKDGESVQQWVNRAVVERLLRQNQTVSPRFGDGEMVITENAVDQLLEVLGSQAGDGKDKADSKARYVRRTREALPDPSLPAGAEVNRRTKQISLRINPSLLASIDSAVAAQDGSDRTSWLKMAIEDFLEADLPLPELAGAAEPVSEVVMIRFEPAFIDLIDKAADAAQTTRADWLRRVAGWQVNQAAAALPYPS